MARQNAADLHETLDSRPPAGSRDPPVPRVVVDVLDPVAGFTECELAARTASQPLNDPATRLSPETVFDPLSSSSCVPIGGVVGLRWVVCADLVAMGFVVVWAVGREPLAAVSASVGSSTTIAVTRRIDARPTTRDLLTCAPISI
jgi:hypothetical protein